MYRTNLSEETKQLMNKLGFGLGLNREGNYYITDNKARMPMRVHEENAEIVTADTFNKTKRLNFKIGNCFVGREGQIFDMIRINDFSDKSILEVVRHENPKTPNSYVQIKLVKDFNGKIFEVNVNLFSNGTITVLFSDGQLFSCSLEESEYCSTQTAKKILANLELADEKVLPVIEYYANNYPLVSQTLSKIKEVSKKTKLVSKIYKPIPTYKTA